MTGFAAWSTRVARIIGTTNRGNPTAVGATARRHLDRGGAGPKSCSAASRSAGIDALILIGGDGSMSIGRHLPRGGAASGRDSRTDEAIDLEKTGLNVGFDTAVDFTSQCINRLFTTTTSHRPDHRGGGRSGDFAGMDRPERRHRVGYTQS